MLEAKYISRETPIYYDNSTFTIKSK